MRGISIVTICLPFVSRVFRTYVFFQYLYTITRLCRRDVEFLCTQTLIPPQELLLRKSTGVVTFGVAGKRNRKSSSTELISLFIIKICSSRNHFMYELHKLSWSHWLFLYLTFLWLSLKEFQNIDEIIYFKNIFVERIRYTFMSFQL